MIKRLIHLPALFAVLLYFTTPAQAVLQRTSTLQVPLSGTVLVPLNDGSFDSVSLSGRANVVTTVPLSDIPPDHIRPVRIHVNLDHVSGVGSITKKEYSATGTNRVTFPAFPSKPIIFGFDLQFPAEPLLLVFPPSPIMPLDINFNFTFNPDTGELSNVRIESMSIPVP